MGEDVTERCVHPDPDCGCRGCAGEIDESEVTPRVLVAWHDDAGDSVDDPTDEAFPVYVVGVDVTHGRDVMVVVRWRRAYDGSCP